MKAFIVLLLSFTLLFNFSCSSDSHTENEQQLSDTTATLSTKGSSRQARLKTTSSKDYQEFHPNGQVSIEGDLDPESNERQGLWVAYYENGQKWSEASYSNGKRNGHSITFYPNGKVRYIGEYKEDKKVGEWIFYNDLGKLDRKETYE
jgi:antitoxin component YwqK of YwqJK toxin-antitoxin module